MKLFSQFEINWQFDCVLKSFLVLIVAAFFELGKANKKPTIGTLEFIVFNYK